MACCIFCSLQKACNERLEWYKSVKGFQATVEVTAVSQMNNIFLYGCYAVGSTKSTICQSYHQVIHLSLKKSKDLTKHSYNLEELRDLESKLVLITGSKAEHREKVDIFNNVSFLTNGTVAIMDSGVKIADLAITHGACRVSFRIFGRDRPSCRVL